LPEHYPPNQRRLPKYDFFTLPKHFSTPLPDGYWSRRSDIANRLASLGIGIKSKSAETLEADPEHPNDAYILSEIILASALDRSQKVFVTADWGFYTSLSQYRDSFGREQQAENGLQVSLIEENFRSQLGPGALMKLRFDDPFRAEVLILVLEPSKKDNALWFRH